jgi:hypothetical protein
MQRDPTTTQSDLENHRLDAQDMQRLAEQMREAAREGKMDDAREKMAELERMLDQLQAARPEHGKMSESERRRAEKRQRGQQQMSALQDMIQRQGGLLDNAQGRSSEPEPPRRQALPRSGDQQGERSPDEQKSAQADRNHEEQVQQALRRALGELMQQYGDLTGEVPPNLGDADSAMREATQALGNGDDQAAAGAEQRAIEALQKGGRSMSQQMAQQFGSGEEQEGDEAGDESEQDGQGDQAGVGPDGDPRGGDRYGPGYDTHRGPRDWAGRRSADRRADDRRDPFGRRLNEGVSGADESDNVRVPDEMERARTRAIQDELRRREAERTRPQPELDYIERLLKQF